MFGYKLVKKVHLDRLEDIRAEHLQRYFTELFNYYPQVEIALRNSGVTIEAMRDHMDEWAADWFNLNYESEPWYEVNSDPAGSANPVSRS